MLFPEISGSFGLGCMRLSLLEDGNVDYKQFCEMVDTFLAAGFNYFDTATSYIGGKSETSIRDCIVKRHPRESFVLTNKLSSWLFEKEEEILPLFQKQLDSCGVDYFDFYLMHAQNREYYKKYTDVHAYEIAKELKKQGKIRHIGISFHDSADILDMILTEHPEIELVQIQFNYLDYNDGCIQSRKCYEVCRKHNKPVAIMEPVKGGSLVNLPEEADKILRDLNGGSNASYALRFAGGFEGVRMVLSGMSNMAQLNDNISFMKNLVPLDEKELEAIDKVRFVFANLNLIKCTACEYCVDGCPKRINIPALFSCYNRQKRNEKWEGKNKYAELTEKSGKASDCISCGKCERECP